MATRRWTIGADIGGTQLKIGLVDRSGRVAAIRVRSTRGLRGATPFIDVLAREAESLARSVGCRPDQLRGIGVGAPGPVDSARGLVRTLVNVPGWRDVPLARRLSRRLRCACTVDNDANLFTLGEWRFGAGQGTTQLIGITLGTGVGGGLVLNGALYRGARGCLEAHVGTAAILSMARRELRRGSGPLRRLARLARGRLTPELVSHAARQGDRGARRVWDEAGAALGVGLASVVNLLNPDRIVIGGGVAGAWPFFYPSLIRTMRAQAMAGSVRAVRVVRSRLADAAGVVGAAVLVWDET